MEKQYIYMFLSFFFANKLAWAKLTASFQIMFPRDFLFKRRVTHTELTLPALMFRLFVNQDKQRYLPAVTAFNKIN
jgi:hypothetical protein